MMVFVCLLETLEVKSVFAVANQSVGLLASCARVATRSARHAWHAPLQWCKHIAHSYVM